MTARTGAPLAVDAVLLRHEVIRASAGSGKTHALSGRYLALLAAGVEPHSILASTFTRAAAGEIRDRLMQRLARAATDEGDESERARRDLAESLGVATVSAAAALGMLSRLVGQVHTLQIRTLDSFFATIVRSFAVELGLPAECEVVDDNTDRSLRREAMRLLLDERDPGAIVELLRLLTRGDADRGVSETIDRTVSTLHELWRETESDAWRWMPAPQGLLSPTQLVDAIQALQACPLLADDRRFAQARRDDLESAMIGDWRGFLAGGLAGKVAAGEDTYYRKTIPQDVLTGYKPLVEHAAAELIHSARAQTLATEALLGLFDAQYGQLKRRRRALTFADLTHALRGAASLGALEDIGYRLDARVHHLLLDEFQDTSTAQWQAIREMCAEVTAQEPPRRTFFCVGDIKQSIYGWRGASPEILERLSSLLPGVAQRSLDRSFRSSPIVMDAVNTVFGNLPANAAMTGDPAHSKAAVAWAATFGPHDVAPSLRTSPGCVQLRTMELVADDKSADRRKRRLREAADLAAHLHRRDQHIRIAILTRTNASVARLLYELGPAGLGVPASGRGGGPLIDAPAVNAILDLLHLADHPDDTTAAFNIASSPLGAALGFSAFNARVPRWKLARQTRRDLLLDGYQATIARWVRLVAGACDARELRRAAQLVDFAGIHDAAEPSLRTQPFIDAVEWTDIPESQPAPIEVMTVHQAKGLEFDAVILPELDGKLRGDVTPMVVFDRDATTGRITRIARYANAQTQALVADLRSLTERTQTRLVRENLSVLYVAMTRARHGLYMLIDPPAENENAWPRSPAGLLRSALAANGCPPSAVVYQRGDEEWWLRASRTSPRIDECQPSEPARQELRFAAEPSTARTLFDAVAPSAARERAIARSRAADLRETLRLTNPEGRDGGVVIHALFERIEWLEDFTSDDAELLAVARAIVPRYDDAWRLRQIAAFRTMLARPAIARLLSRGDVPTERVRLHRELPFVRATPDGIQSGVMDRLVLEVDSRERPLAATIIDFKTDTIAGAVSEQAEMHRVQLQMYRDVAGEQFKLAPQSIAMVVLFVGAGEAVTLSPGCGKH